jgi:tellurite resistance protein TehA-like permease
MPDQSTAAVRAGESVPDDAQPRSRIATVRASVASFVAGVLGLAPHVLHHVGPIAGAALITGVGGTIVFALLGFLLTIPFLLRLRHRFGTWRAPAIALAVFAAMFAVSTFVLGPVLFGDGVGHH